MTARGTSGVAYRPPPTQFTNGVLAKYARHVGSAAEGAVTT